MIFVIFTSIILAVCLPIIFTYFRHVLSMKKYPSGPFPLPIIGNLHLMTERPHEVFRAMAQIYGNVFSLSLGMKRVVIINTIEPAKEALISKGRVFAGRPTDIYTSSYLTRDFTGMTFHDYDKSHTHLRKLSSRALKMYGDSSANVVKVITKESEDLHRRLKISEGKPVDIRTEFGLPVLNVMSLILFGERYDKEDKEVAQLFKMEDVFHEAFKHGDPISVLPWLRFFPSKTMNLLKEYVTLRDQFYVPKISKHIEEFNEDDIKDFVGVLIQQLKDKSTEIGKMITRDSVDLVANEMFVAGHDTIVSTFTWLVLFLVYYSNYQTEIYEEIISVVGKERYPEIKDREELHLVNAFIAEVHRYVTISPFGLPHKTMEDTSIAAKNIPKDTMIMFNFWNINHDERHWEKPFEFNPKRWFDEEGRFSQTKNISFLAFGSGKRSCIGEAMAKTELFVMFTRMIKDFCIENNPNEKFPTLKATPTIVQTPFPFTVVLKSRN